jgi:hypothetical protein
MVAADKVAVVMVVVIQALAVVVMAVAAAAVVPIAAANCIHETEVITCVLLSCEIRGIEVE